MIGQAVGGAGTVKEVRRCPVGFSLLIPCSQHRRSAHPQDWEGLPGTIYLSSLIYSLFVGWEREEGYTVRRQPVSPQSSPSEKKQVADIWSCSPRKNLLSSKGFNADNDSGVVGEETRDKAQKSRRN